MTVEEKGPERNLADGDTGRQAGKRVLLLLLLMLVAFGLRIHDLDGQSMWSDEGLSLYRAQQELPVLLQNVIVVDGVKTQDTNPAFYFLALHGWRALAGESVFALRFLGAMAALLAVPLTYALGKMAFGRRAGMAAALLMAVSPFHVWQAQVLRNYGLLITINLFSVYGLFRFGLGSGRRRLRWGALGLWAAAGLLGIYTHYFGFFMFAYGLLALGWLALRGKAGQRLLRERRLWAVVLLGVLLLVPAGWLALSRFLAGRQVDFYHVPWTHVATHAASAFSVGLSPTLTHPQWRVLPAVGLALAGVLAGWRRRPVVAQLLLGYQFVPLGMLLLLSLFNPLYNGARHLLIGLPPFLLFVAAGIVLPRANEKETGSFLTAIWRLLERDGIRRLAMALGALVLASQIAWLWVQFNSPRLIRDDVRGAAVYLNDVVRPEDVVVLHDAIIRFTFDYYYQGNAPVVSVPRFGQMDEDAAEAALAAAGQRGDRIWFLTDPEPRTGFDREVLSAWAEREWTRIFNRRFPALWLPVNLRGYVSQSQPESLPTGAAEAGASWSEPLRLHGYEAPGSIRAGNDWWLSLYLSQHGLTRQPYGLSLRLVDERGQVWAQTDHLIGRDERPPSTWPQDKLIRYDVNVPLPAGLPAGRYRSTLRLIEQETGAAVALAGGGVEVPLAEVTVQAASCDAARERWPAHVPRDVRLAPEVTLLGYTPPQGQARPGHTVPVGVLWCALERPEEDYHLRLQLVNGSGDVIAEATGPLTRPDYPPTSWTAGELVWGKAAVTVPATAAAGEHDLRLSLEGAGGEAPFPWPIGRPTADLGTAGVVPWPLETELPPIPSPIRADFGEPTQIELRGYGLTPDTPTPGEQGALTLIWRSTMGEIDANYHIFVHLTDEEGGIVAQADGPPVSGFRPTTSWRAGEVIVDERALDIPADAAPGTYHLWVGLYEPDSSRRPPTSVGEERAADGRVLLQTVTVEGDDDD